MLGDRSRVAHAAGLRSISALELPAVRSSNARGCVRAPLCYRPGSSGKVGGSSGTQTTRPDDTDCSADVKDPSPRACHDSKTTTGCVIAAPSRLALWVMPGESRLVGADNQSCMARLLRETRRPRPADRKRTITNETAPVRCRSRRRHPPTICHDDPAKTRRGPKTTFKPTARGPGTRHSPTKHLKMMPR